MPILTANDPLPHRPSRVLVAGTSGAGKTAVAARVAEALSVPHIEIDALFHGSGWAPRDSFEADVRAFSAQPSWVTEWQYPAARPLLVDRADLLVWLDLPRATVMRQVVKRTLRRRLRHEVLWNDNTERPLWTIFTDPDHIVRWAWSTHAEGARRVVTVSHEHPDLVIVRLDNWRSIDAWLRGPLCRSADMPPGLG